VWRIREALEKKVDDTEKGEGGEKNEWGCFLETQKGTSGWNCLEGEHTKDRPVFGKNTPVN